MAKKIEIQFERPNFNNVLERVREDPIGGLAEFGAAYVMARKGDRLMRREGMAACCEACLQIGDEEDEWARLQRKATRLGIEYEPRKNSRLVLAMLVALQGVSYPRIVVYAGGCQKLIEDGVEPKDISKEIKARGGIDRIYNGEDDDGGPANGRAAGGAPARSGRSRGKSGASDSASEGDDEEGADRDNNDREGDDSADGDDGESTSSTPPADPPEVKKAIRDAAKLIRAASGDGWHWEVVEVGQTLFERTMSIGEGGTVDGLEIHSRGKISGGLTRLGLRPTKKKTGD